MRLLFLLPFLMAGCADETISGFADRSADYRLIELNGTPFEATATVRFPDEGRAEGNGPCNAWSAVQSAPYPWIELGPIAATRRACPALEAESVFFTALQDVSLAEIAGNVLILSGNETQLVFLAE